MTKSEAIASLRRLAALSSALADYLDGPGTVTVKAIAEKWNVNPDTLAALIAAAPKE